MTLLLQVLEGLLLQHCLRRLPRVKDKLLEIPSIYQLLELSPERAAIHDTVSHSIVKSVVLFVGLGGSGLEGLTKS